MGLRILLADPRDLVRQGLHALLAAIQAVEAIDEVDTAEQLQQYLATQQQIDLLIVHQALLTDFPLLPEGHFVVLVDKLEWGKLFTALDEGAIGYLLENSWNQLLSITLQISQKEGEHAFLLDPAITPLLLDRARNSTNSSPPIDRLTTRQREVFLCLRKELADAEIASELFITEATVRSHISSIQRKLRVARKQIKYLHLPDDDAQV